MYLVLIIISAITIAPLFTLFNFNKSSDLSNWLVINDGVMGGRSQSQLTQTPEGHGLFKGSISLDNNGGFASVRYRFSQVAVNKHSTIRIRLKGDGKKYQLRIKNNLQDYQSYITYFETSGEWEEISIKASDMIPTFRGRLLNMPAFDHSSFEEIGFLFGNKKEEDFRLLIDYIVVE